MNLSFRSWAPLAGAMAVASTIALTAGTARPQTTGPSASAPAPQQPRSNSKPPNPLPAAERMRISAGHSAATALALLDEASPEWAAAAPTPIILARTPRVYPSEPKLDTPPPALEVKVLRAEQRLVVRMSWSDATQDVPQAPPAKTGEGGGEPSRLYHRPTEHTSSFPDAAAVMIPDAWTGPGFPSLMKGDTNDSATFYYWNGSRGGSVLSATGRATIHPIPGATLAYRAGWSDGHWTVVMSMPDQPDGYPVAFAVWDGSQGNRDGLKFFSIWYVLAAAGGARR